MFKITIHFTLNNTFLGAFLQCRRWEWVSGLEIEVCPKGSFWWTKEGHETLKNTNGYVLLLPVTKLHT